MPTGVSRDITISLANATFSKVNEFWRAGEAAAEPGLVWWPGQARDVAYGLVSKGLAPCWLKSLDWPQRLVESSHPDLSGVARQSRGR